MRNEAAPLVTEQREARTAVLPAEMVLRTAAACRAELAALLGDGAAGLTLDGSEVEAIDASGLQVLLACAEAARAAGISLALSRCSEVLLDALELTGLRARFGVEPAGSSA